MPCTPDYGDLLMGHRWSHSLYRHGLQVGESPGWHAHFRQNSSNSPRFFIGELLISRDCDCCSGHLQAAVVFHTHTRARAHVDDAKRPHPSTGKSRAALESRQAAVKKS